jgi:hypothetical protein
MRPSALIALLALAACSRGDPPAANTVAPPAAEAAAVAEPAPADYLGRWTGVEGMYLVVSRGLAPGLYRLEMQWSLDNKGTFEGKAVGDTIAFERNGVLETLRPTDGAATKLKWLDGKKTCLTVKPGEGYCREP